MHVKTFPSILACSIHNENNPILSWKEVADWFSYVVRHGQSFDWVEHECRVGRINWFSRRFALSITFLPTNCKWLNIKKFFGFLANKTFLRARIETQFRLHFARGEIWHYCMWRFKLPAKKRNDIINAFLSFAARENVNAKWNSDEWVSRGWKNLCGAFFRLVNYHNVVLH